MWPSSPSARSQTGRYGGKPRPERCNHLLMESQGSSPSPLPSGVLPAAPPQPPLSSDPHLALRDRRRSREAWALGGSWQAVGAPKRNLFSSGAGRGCCPSQRPSWGPRRLRVRAWVQALRAEAQPLEVCAGEVHSAGPPTDTGRLMPLSSGWLLYGSTSQLSQLGREETGITLGGAKTS